MKTRDNRTVRIFCADGGGAFPVLGAICGSLDMAGADYWDVHRWSSDGVNRAHFSRDHDIHPDCLPEFKAAIAGGDFQSLEQAGAAAASFQRVVGSASKEEPATHLEGQAPC